MLKYLNKQTLLRFGMGMVAAALLASTGTYYVRYTAARDELSQLRAQQWADQAAAGFACGLITYKEAEALLGTPVQTASTVIASSAPTAGVRLHSPRVDACKHTAAHTSAGYVDLTIKYYGSEKEAREGRDLRLKELLGAQEKARIDGRDEIWYADGLHLVLRDLSVIEASASKVAGMTAAEREDFSWQLTQRILQKL